MQTQLCALGAVRVSQHGDALTCIELLDADDNARDDTLLLGHAHAQLRRYFARELQAFDLPLATCGTPFQQRVWQALRVIPYGVTRTYQEVATQLQSKARPVGGANGKNPWAIVVPCHRVVGSVGLVGYAGGLWRKQWLLKHEGALLT